MPQSNFNNPMMDVADLPQIQELDKQRLSEKYASTNLKVGACVVLLLLIIAFILYFQPFIEVSQNIRQNLLFISSAIIIIVSLVVLLGYQADIRKSYTLRDLDIHYSSGLFFRKTVSQPITRIQHIELKRGPIDRKINLAKLQVFSAGGAMHTFEIPGLPLETAQQLRQYIIEHKDVTNHEK
ncbi:PH domain-containing protein [Paraglaciecola aquimarina]|uniref:PH domain-containing protein n=1 Tax=Paraglaciecola algarum TaxID=3050085 RepID=A0ABS9DDK4_9ALTE|nr:PH domain-containing protein [Paraglaciecola sp. G1-23]MCF2950092.1 PH domain-containing protein [Paraglaciecola sp. G1-23]